MAIGTAGETACPTLLDQSFGKLGGAGGFACRRKLISIPSLIQIPKTVMHPSVKPFGHTQAIPWKCRQLVIGAGAGALPVMDEVKHEAKHRKIKLLVLPTRLAIQELKQEPCWLQSPRWRCIFSPDVLWPLAWRWGWSRLSSERLLARGSTANRQPDWQSLLIRRWYCAR